MIFDIILTIVHWILSIFVAILPVMETPPTWLSSITVPLGFVYNLMDGFMHVGIVLSAFGAMVPIVILYEIFHKVDQTAMAVRGVSIDKSHL